MIKQLLKWHERVSEGSSPQQALGAGKRRDGCPEERRRRGGGQESPAELGTFGLVELPTLDSGSGPRPVPESILHNIGVCRSIA